MARSSEAVARASASRCAAAWPLAWASACARVAARRRCGRRGQSAVHGVGEGPVQFGRSLVDGASVPAVQGQAERHQLILKRLERALQCGGVLHGLEFLRGVDHGADQLSLPAQQFLGIDDQLVGNGLGVDLELAVPDRPAQCVPPSRCQKWRLRPGPTGLRPRERSPPWRPASAAGSQQVRLHPFFGAGRRGDGLRTRGDRSSWLTPVRDTLCVRTQ